MTLLGPAASGPAARELCRGTVSGPPQSVPTDGVPVPTIPDPAGPSSLGPARVGIVVLTHDRPDFLAETLASARAQTYPHLEIVVSDDGSTDPRMVALLGRLEAEGLRVLRHDHGGVGSSVNRAVAALDTEYVMPLGDDDVIDPPYVAAAVAAAEADPHLGIVYCRAEFFGDVTGPWRLPDFEIGGILLANQIFATALFRRADWIAVGGYDERMREGREDHDFVLRILGLGRTVRRLEGTWFHYRRHPLASLNRGVGESREVLVRAHATIFRNNLDLYAQHAEEFWSRIFERADEINDLRHRYRRLEELRRRHPRVLAVARGARRGLSALATAGRGRAASLRAGRGPRRGSAPTSRGT